jgi:hypothetical protein
MINLKCIGFIKYITQVFVESVKHVQLQGRQMVESAENKPLVMITAGR